MLTGKVTGIGKTVFSAMLTLGLGAHYWKPIQCGVEDGIDTRIIQNLTGLPDERFLSEAYILSEPLSPHLRFLTRGSLRRLLGEMGFAVLSLERRARTLLVRATG